MICTEAWGMVLLGKDISTCTRAERHALREHVRNCDVCKDVLAYVKKRLAEEMSPESIQRGTESGLEILREDTAAADEEASFRGVTDAGVHPETGRRRMAGFDGSDR